MRLLREPARSYHLFGSRALRGQEFAPGAGVRMEEPVPRLPIVQWRKEGYRSRRPADQTGRRGSREHAVASSRFGEAGAESGARRGNSPQRRTDAGVVRLAKRLVVHEANRDDAVYDPLAGSVLGPARRP